MRDWLVVSEATQQSQFRSNVARNRVSSSGRRAINQFTSAQHQQFIGARAAYRDIAEGVKTKNPKLVRKGAAYIGSYMAQAAIINAITNKGDLEEEALATDLAIALTVQGVPNIYPVANSIKWMEEGLRKGYKPKGTTGIPGADLMVDATINMLKYKHERFDKDSPDLEKANKYKNKAIKDMAVANGIPIKNVGKWIEGVKSIKDGTSQNLFFDAIGAGKEAGMIQPMPEESEKDYIQRAKDIGVANDKEMDDEKTEDIIKMYYESSPIARQYLDEFHNPLETIYTKSMSKKLAFLVALSEETDTPVEEIFDELKDSKTIVTRNFKEFVEQYLSDPEKYKDSKDYGEVKDDLKKYKEQFK
jgi:hypothetical protein